MRTPRRIFLLATKVGQTNAFFFDAQGKQILSLDIRVEKDVVDLGSLMKAAMPNSAIQVQALNDNVVLTGSVSSALESTRAADLAAKFTGDAKKVVNMLGIAAGAAGDAEGAHRRDGPQHRQAVRPQSSPAPSRRR